MQWQANMGYYDKEKMKEKEYSEEGYISFLKDNNWKYDFVKNEEFSTSDAEQSFLSRMIFCHLFEKIDSLYMCELPRGDNIAIQVSKKGRSELCYFLFDVMHNPKKSCQPADMGEAVGSKISFGKIYHTIGNFAPIPRTVTYNNYGQNLQFIHSALNELWCWMLKFMKDNWKCWPTKVGEIISFEDYMILSCQHLYFQEIFDEFYPLYSNKSLEHVKWSECITEWNTKIRSEKSDCLLLSFDDLFDKLPKNKKRQVCKEDKNIIKEIDKRISFLIEARGRCILEILRER